MVNVVSAISSAQTTPLKVSVQSANTPEPTPPPPLTSIDFVTSEYFMDNLQNVAILEYRSSQTGDVIQQYPNQAQINAFKAAQQLAHAAELQHQELGAEHGAVDAPHTAQTTQTAQTTESHVSAPPVSTASFGGSSAGSAGSAGKSTTSIVA